MSRDDLAEFLRACRSRVRPADVGLPAGSRRRIPGLRREEVAQRAGISVDYYIRLEQARGPHPSVQVLGALARALCMSADERAHLLRLACADPPPAGDPGTEVPTAVRHLLELLGDLPAYVLNPRYDVLAWNTAALALVADFAAWPDGERNLIWQVFRGAADRAAGGAARDKGAGGGVEYSFAQWDAFAGDCVADLREAAGRYPHDAQIADLVARLRAASPDFAHRWDANEVAVRRGNAKQLFHRSVGPLELEQQILQVPDRDQRLIVYVPVPGSPSADALRLVSIVGSERW
jgi:transcriptional regulator with XRE-family HTH domain